MSQLPDEKLDDVLPPDLLGDPELGLPLEFIELTERLAGDRFHIIAEIRDPDGSVVRISERSTDGRLSFAFFREFEKGGSTERSSYLAHRHIPSLRRLMDELDRRLPGMEDRTRGERRIAASRR